MNDYGKFAYKYDMYFSRFDYDGLADYLMELWRCSSLFDNKILDLGCGTGSMMLELSGRGAEVTGVDISDDMLSIADNKLYEKGNGYLLRKADIASYRDNEKYDKIICLCDTFNYLDDTGIATLISNVSSMIIDGGYFVFDIISPFIKPDNKESFFLSDGTKLEMIRTFKGKKMFTDVVITNNGNISSEKHEQYIYTTDYISELLEINGFSAIKVYGFMTKNTEDLTSKKMIFCCKK